MPRRAKKKAEKDEGSQAASPPESEEDRLVRVGMTMWLAKEMGGEGFTRRDIEHAIEHGAHGNLGDTPPDLRRLFLELGKQDPRPFMERLKQSCQTLLVLCQNQEQEKRLVEQMQSTLADLELVLKVRRYGGRPKGIGKKIKPADMERIYQWMKDRKKGSKPTAKEFAKELKMSRQTLHMLTKKIEAEEKESLKSD